MREGTKCTSNCSMLTLPEKAFLVKLFYQNEESATASLRSYRHRKGIQTGEGPMTSSAVISKFKTTGCLDDGPCSGQPSARANAEKYHKAKVKNLKMMV